LLGKKQELHFMYIQMEYCDKQTLRTAIDEGLYKNTERVWRMFRVRKLLKDSLFLIAFD
jgi:hypothetical protein